MRARLLLAALTAVGLAAASCSRSAPSSKGASSTGPSSTGPSSTGPSSTCAPPTRAQSTGASSTGASPTGASSTGAASTSSTGPTAPDPSAPDPSAPDPSAPDPSAPNPSAPNPSAPDPSAPDPSAPDPSAPDPSAPDPSAPDPSAPDPSAPDPSAPDPSAPDRAASSSTPADAPGPTVDGCDPAPPPPAHGGALRWYEDDFEAALACARKLGRPLVLDLWAPWCHTCLSMQQTVLADPRLAAHSGRFVLASLDTDRPENADAVAAFPPLAWPTFYVVDASREAILARHVGAATLEQLEVMLETGDRLFRSAPGDRSLPPAEGSGDPQSAPEDPDRLVSQGHAAEAEEAYARAAELYERALSLIPQDAPGRPVLLVSRIRALSRAGEHAACIELAEREGTRTGRSASAADFALYARRCAEAQGGSEAAAVLDRIVRHVEAAVGDGDRDPIDRDRMSVDDRSDALRILRAIALFRDRPEAARAYAEAQRALLDQAMAGAPPEVAMTYNWPAAEVYTFLGEPRALVPRLEANARALPEAYDPPFRLAWLLLQAGAPDEARPWIERALERVYGPRKARALALLAEIAVAQGDREEARRAREDAVRLLERLPEGQRDPEALEKARAALPRPARDPARR